MRLFHQLGLSSALALVLALGLAGPGAAEDLADPSAPPTTPSASDPADTSARPDTQGRDAKRGDSANQGTAKKNGAVTKSGKVKTAGYNPPLGPAFNSPFAAGGRGLSEKIRKTIRNSRKGDIIRIAVWNYDDAILGNALIKAKKRGVVVRFVTSKASTQTPRWGYLASKLNKNNPKKPRSKRSAAVRCKGGCRSGGSTMHSKLYLFERKGKKRKNLYMVGSNNLTYAAASNQWNDMITDDNQAVYKFMRKTFNEYAKDKRAGGYKVKQFGRVRATLYPAYGRNPILSDLNKIRCTGAGKGYGNAAGRTIIRIAVAAWFDDYGQQIANRVRTLWNQGCDVRIVTTLAGGGINRTLKSTGGRGPIPIKKLTIDTDGDGVPNKYLHTKFMTVNGVFAGDKTAAVVLAGTANWTVDARNAEEIQIRFKERPKWVAAYNRTFNSYFNSRYAHYRTTPESLLRSEPESNDSNGVGTAPGEFSLY